MGDSIPKRKKPSSAGARQLCKIIERSRPELWNEAAFVDAVNQLGIRNLCIHACLPS
jgi:hypothetical protein